MAAYYVLNLFGSASSTNTNAAVARFVSTAFWSGRAVGDQVVLGFALVATLRQWAHCTFGSDMIGKFATVVAPVKRKDQSNLSSNESIQQL